MLNALQAGAPAVPGREPVQMLAQHLEVLATHGQLMINTAHGP